MNPEEVKEIFSFIRLNRKKLRECDKHDFEPIMSKPTKYKCNNCGGEVDITFVEGYIQGLGHGKPDWPKIKSEADKILDHLGVKNESRN